MKYITPAAVVSTAFILSACGGSSSSGGSGTPDMQMPTANTLSALLQTGTDTSDLSTRWDCVGSDGQDPVNFSQRFFADDIGQIEEGGETAPFSWSSDDATSFSVTFPADANGAAQTFSIVNVSFSTVNSANDTYTGTDSRDNTALSCSKIQEAAPPAFTGSLTELIVNTADGSDFSWDCAHDNGTDERSSYEFNADGTGRRFAKDQDLFAFIAERVDMFWTADEANSLIDITWNGENSSLSNIVFQDADNFTAVDNFESEGIQCTRFDIPAAPTPPPAPTPVENTSCPCDFASVEQFLIDSAEPSTTVFVSNIAGGRLLDIDLPGTTFQLSARNVGIRDCGLSFNSSSYTGENQNFSSLTTAQADTCLSQLDSIENNN